MAAHDIYSARVFDVARSNVFAAFADPARLARWWGPAGAVSVFETFEFRPGGRWTFVMRLPDGAEFAMRQRFVEIVPPERVVIAHDQVGHDFTLTAQLEAVDDARTRLHWTMHFASPDEAARVRDIVLVANEENFDRLAAEVGPRAGGTPSC